MATSLSWEIELHVAVSENDRNRFKDILARDEVRWYGYLGRREWAENVCPLQHAALMGRKEMIRALVEAGMDVNSCRIGTGSGGYRATALHWAVWGNEPDTVRTLLNLGADMTLEGRWGMPYPLGSSLDWAKNKEGREEIVRILEDHAAKPPKPMSLTSFVKMDPVSKIKQKLRKVQDLEDAHRIRAEIEEKREQIPEKEERLKNEKDKLNNEKERLRDKEERLKKEEEALQTLKKDLKNLEEQPILVYMEDVKSQLDEIETIEKSLKTALGVDKDRKDSNTCPVCFLFAQQVFICEDCDNWVCQECQGQLATCPTCRVDLVIKPLRRCIGMEKVMGIM